jgi:hypothetical protein
MAHEINNPMGIIHARGSDLMEAAAEKDSGPRTWCWRPFKKVSLHSDCRPTEISQVPLNLWNNAVDAVEPLPEKCLEVTVKNVGRECGDFRDGPRQGYPKTIQA